MECRHAGHHHRLHNHCIMSEAALSALKGAADESCGGKQLKSGEEGVLPECCLLGFIQIFLYSFHHLSILLKALSSGLGVDVLGMGDLFVETARQTLPIVYIEETHSPPLCHPY